MTIRNPVEWGYDAIRETVHGLGHTAHDWNRPREELSDTPVVQRITIGGHTRRHCRRDSRILAPVGQTSFSSPSSIPWPVSFWRNVALHNEMLPLLFPLDFRFRADRSVRGCRAVRDEPKARTRTGGLMVRRRWRAQPAIIRSVHRAGAVADRDLRGLAGSRHGHLLAHFRTLRCRLRSPSSPVRSSRRPRAGLSSSSASASASCSLCSCSRSAWCRFPLLLDRNVTLKTAIASSVRAVRMNPGPMLLWGMIVASGLFLGAIPFCSG